MNFLTVKLSHTYFTQQSIKNLLINIDNYNIKIYTENKLLFSVAEFYYSVHDWIVDVCEIKNEEYKSRTYKNDQLMKIIQRKMQGLIE